MTCVVVGGRVIRGPSGVPHISLGVRKAWGSPEEPARQLVGVLWQLRKAGVAEGLIILT